MYASQGNNSLVRGDFNGALAFFQQYLVITKEIGDGVGEGRVCGGLGYASLALGDFQENINYYQLRLSIAKEVGDRSGEGKACSNLASAFLSLRNFKKAAEYSHLCLSLAKNIGDRAGEGRAYGDPGNAYLSLGDFLKAMDFFQLRLDIAQELEDRAGERGAYCNLGNAHFSLGDFQKAKEHYQLDLNCSEQVGDRAGEGRAHGNLGSVHSSLGNFKEAIPSCKIALSVAKEVKDRIKGDDEGGPVLREHGKPDGRLSVGRSRCGFPDCREDHFVQLLVCKSQHTREALDITDKYEITVAVSYDRVGESSLKMPDYQCKRIKSESKSDRNGSVIGVVGYLFRFHEPDTKYKISFSLCVIPQRKRGKISSKKQAAGEKISEIFVTLETRARASSKSGKTRKTAKARSVSPLFKLSPASLSEESTMLLERSSWVMNQLQSRRDNAKWEDFDKYASDLLLKFPDTDTRIAIKLEQSVRACFQNELECSLQLIDESFSLIPQAKNSHILAARGYGYRAGVMRRQRNLGEASDMVQLAEQNSHACHTNLDTSLIIYERACVLLDFIGRMPQRSPKLVNEALRNFEKCIDVCLRREGDDGDLYVKLHHFAFIKMAMLLLDCRTEAARERVVCEEFIAKGQECLNMLKTKYWSAIAEGAKIQFNLASSDLEYRKGNLAEAEKFARQAKVMAIALGFNTEISHAQERLDHLRALTREWSAVFCRIACQ